MAITKLLRINETSGSYKSIHLKHNIFYICNPEKTGNGMYIGGNAGYDPQSIYDTFMWNKHKWNKLDKSQGFHYTLSFPPDCGVTEEMVCQIAQEFCDELLQDRFFYVFAVHNDKPHLHAHITFDSVSKTDGYKWHSPKGDWYKRIQPIADRLCEKYNLPTLFYEEEKKRAEEYKKWKKETYTWNDIIRDDIDEAIQASDTYEEFLEYLKNQNYEIRDGKYLSLKNPDREKAVRSFRLGEGYGKEEIKSRIANKGEVQERYKTYGDREKVRTIIYKKIQRTKGKWKMAPFQKAYFRKWNNTYFIRKPGRMPEAWRYKKDILEVQKLTEELNYIIDFDIKGVSDVLQRRERLLEQRKNAESQRDAMKTKLYRKQPYKQVGSYLKAKKQLEEYPDGSLELEKKLRMLKAEIEETSPLEEAINGREELKKSIREIGDVRRDLDKEIKLLNRVLERHCEYQDETEKIIQQEEKELAAVSNAKKTSNRKETEKKKTKTGNYTMVTINEKLFVNVDMDKATVCTRIPLQKEHVTFPTEDCIMYENGKTLSVYIYDNKNYQVGEREITGEELKKYYDDRTKGKRKNGGERGKTGNLSDKKQKKR